MTKSQDIPGLIAPLDPTALEAAKNAIIDVWDDARGVDPNLYSMATTAIRAYLSAVVPKSEGQ